MAFRRTEYIRANHARLSSLEKVMHRHPNNETLILLFCRKFVALIQNQLNYVIQDPLII